MNRFLSLTVAGAAVASSLSANADVINAKFSGTVSTQINSGLSVGTAVSGAFAYDTVASRYLTFTIAGQSVAAGFASAADVTPDLYSAIYEAQVSPLQQGGTLNSTFALDLEGLNPWSSNNALALLTNAAQLAANLDAASSSFGYFTANSDGTNVRALNATLTGLQVIAVPEPSTAALLLAGIAAIGFSGIHRRRRNG